MLFFTVSVKLLKSATKEVTSFLLPLPLMKKCFIFLLLLITMSATLFPCCGKDDCCNDILSTKTTDNRNHKAEGTCSPFITCVTCSGFTQMTNVINIPLMLHEKLVHHSKIISLKLSSYTASLLQPPQVA